MALVSLNAGLKVVSDTNNRDGLVDVLWDKRLVEMFAVDFDTRGTEITELSAKA